MLGLSINNKVHFVYFWGRIPQIRTLNIIENFLYQLLSLDKIVFPFIANVIQFNLKLFESTLGFLSLNVSLPSRTFKAYVFSSIRCKFTNQLPTSPGVGMPRNSQHHEGLNLNFTHPSPNGAGRCITSVLE